MKTLKERRIDRAIKRMETARKLYFINKLKRDLVERPETFTAHLDRLGAK